MKTQGYFIAANGKHYCDMSKEVLIPSIRIYDKTREISILTDMPQEFEDVENIKIIYYDSEKLCNDFNLSRLPLDNYEKYGTIPRLMSFVLSEYDETLILDVDQVCLKNLDIFWEECSNSKKDIVYFGVSDENNNAPDSWHWATVNDIRKNINFSIPQIGGGIFYSNSNNKDMISFIKKYWDNPETYGIKSWFRGATPCEIFISLYLGNKNIRPLNFDPYVYFCSNYYDLDNLKNIKNNYYFIHFLDDGKNINGMKSFVDKLKEYNK